MLNKNEKNDIGILFNDEKVNLDQEIKYRENITFNFDGKAVLYKKNKKGKIKKEIIIKNGDKVKKNGYYTLFFINKNYEKYNIDFQLRKRFLLIIILLFLLGLWIGLFITGLNNSNVNSNINLNKKLNISVFSEKDNENDLEIIKQNEFPNEKPKDEYIFNIIDEIKVNVKQPIPNPNNIKTEEKIEGYVKFINLMNNYNPKTLVNNMIAPGTSGTFKITIKSNQSLNYSIGLLDISKPKNMYFTISNNSKKYYDFNELLNENLKGNINKNEKKSFIINWYWDYESNDDMQDIIDSINDFYIKINLNLQGGKK